MISVIGTEWERGELKTAPGFWLGNWKFVSFTETVKKPEEKDDLSLERVEAGISVVPK